MTKPKLVHKEPRLGLFIPYETNPGSDDSVINFYREWIIVRM